MQSTLSKATLGRLPLYLKLIRRMDAEKVSATRIAKELGLGEVQVRKDLASVCAAGLPRVGYPVSILRRDMEKALGVDVPVPVVVVGAGKLGTALMDYDGFRDYGVEIIAAFDRSASICSRHVPIPVHPMDQFAAFCASHHIRTGILAVPAMAAQAAADEMTSAGLTAILNFAPYPIKVPSRVTVHPVNIALSLAYLHLAASETGKQEQEEENGTQSI